MNSCCQLISRLDSGKLMLTPEGLDLLNSLKHRLSIISITGPYRSGKSFILNSLLKINRSGFQVGSNVISCTQGIWIYPTMLDGKLYLFLDVEGFGSTSRTSSDDGKLFALSILCSSLVLYNSTGVINEHKINHMALALSYCEIINTQIQALGSPPKLIWILRDFVLELIDSQNKKITSTEYLENVLKDDSKAKNRDNFVKMREIIKQTFVERECVTLPRPAESEEVLQDLDNVKIEELRPEFQKGLKKLRKRVEECGYKQYAGKNVRGKDLAGMLHMFINALNSDAIPNIPSAWNGIIESEYEKIVELIMDEIDKLKLAIQYKLPMEDEEIILIFKHLKEKSDQALIDCYFRNEILTRTSIEKITKTMEALVEELVNANKQACLEHNVEILNSLFPPLFFAIENNEFQDLDKLEIAWSSIMDEYENRSKGSSKFLAIAEFSKRNSNSDLAKALSTIVIEMKKQISELKLQEKMMDIENSQDHERSNEEIKTAIILNRYRMQQLNQQIKIIQKNVLKKLLQKINGEPAVLAKPGIEFTVFSM